MINRLKQLCGFEYTSKLQKMFTGQCFHFLSMLASKKRGTEVAGLLALRGVGTRREWLGSAFFCCCVG